MIKTPIIITIILIIIATIFSFLLLDNERFTLYDSDIVISLILIFTCLGGLVSATFVIWSYIITNTAFILSQKPALLINITNDKVRRSNNNDEMLHVTKIFYKNTTNNAFYDLTINVILEVADRVIDLSDLFTKNMYMAGFDERNRNIITLDVLNQRNVDLVELTSNGHEAILKVSYCFTFNNVSENIQVQKYRWETDKQLWSIK